ncbi:helicase-related protein, partial [Paenibacillus sp. 1001270B_150601_E10]|uniref:helicase-related protein n=1 Tax=Paenibacillus sp. 1001270B_150601_E10 TaxID=2787079 RepID=UPI001E3EB4D3
MKVWLYAVRDLDEWHMMLSMDRAVDELYWDMLANQTNRKHWSSGMENHNSMHFDRRYSQIWMEQKVTLVTALFVKKLFDQFKREKEPLAFDQWRAPDWEASIRQWMISAHRVIEGQKKDNPFQMHRVGNQLLKVGQWEEKLSQHIHVEVRYPNVQGPGHHVAKELEALRLESLSQEMSVMIEGRSLFESELLSLLRGRGLEWKREQLYRVLQWGLVSNKLVVQSGITWPFLDAARIMDFKKKNASASVDSANQEHRKKNKALSTRGGADMNDSAAYTMRRVKRLMRSLLSIRIQVDKERFARASQRLPYCQRCGAKGDDLQESFCESCGSRSCYSCKACLQLARSRSCALLIQCSSSQEDKTADGGTLTMHDRLSLKEHRRMHVSLDGRSVMNKDKGHLRLHSARDEDIDSFLEPYHLAPAQRDASRTALQYLASRLYRGDGDLVNPSLLDVPTEPLNTVIPSPIHMQRRKTQERQARQVGGSRLEALPASGTEPHRGRTSSRSIFEDNQGPISTTTKIYPALNKGVGIEGQGEFLLWAVTGAGKTEMMFPMTAYMLAHQQKVCIATPRRDVVLELMPRIKKAFPEAKVVTLYGGSEERWDSGDITLTTTHQLLRFRRAFDLMVVDELDAFPYHNNPMLERAAKLACREGGTFVFLSATPPGALARAAKRGRLAQATVPVRYHRHPLPVPKRLPMPSAARMIANGRLPSRVVGALHHAVERGAQLFVFVARIRHIDGAVALLRRSFPQQAIAGTSASDAERTEKVQAFRRGEIRILVTTTILERGVTVPKSDVFIWDADDKLFDEASLVQMAGRAGRSKDDPNGNVYFGAAQWTKSQRAAVRQIRAMNHLAKQGG